ncbi:hypothetical protein, variant [Verruconis gallopava]|uniref:RGS domain-containing protein n=1 Tax=Verruconis gallopava TaxID=253628 RepID=A0A0D1Z934_9PEZI|nr:hypothetical protein, variant [Verruconis gallopava]KIW09482.1 hypothetical protein, variant [Verruconis gallopava]
MVYSLTYTRPPYVPPPSRDSLVSPEKPGSLKDSIHSGTSHSSRGIPDALSFDRIISGGTCPPVTIRDFMDFLKYIERSAENLQFFLWFKDYEKRFSSLPDSERVLSPEWTQEQAEAEAATYRAQLKDKSLAAEAQDIMKKQKLVGSEAGNEKSSPVFDSDGDKSSIESGSTKGLTSAIQSSRSQYSETAKQAFEDAGARYQPFTIQPYREEMSRIITIYIAENAPRQLNLSSRERTALLHALEVTTHPSAFRNVLKTVEWTLRRQAHPNFIRWSICNGNRPRVFFARFLGVAGIAGGILTGLLITLSTASRAWRVMAMIPFMFGISTLIAAWKGMCVVLHGLHHRHMRPWEMFENDDYPRYSEEELKKVSFETFSSSQTHSYEDEPWVAKYKKRNIIRKIFDREVWVEEPALRQIQDTIFLQAILGALVCSAILTGIFCAVPNGNFF